MEEKYQNLKNNKSELIKESNLLDIYTYKNNHPVALFTFINPLNLSNCIRIYSYESGSDSFFWLLFIGKKIL